MRRPEGFETGFRGGSTIASWVWDGAESFRRRRLANRSKADKVLRDQINTSLKESMKAGDKVRLGTLRLINAAIKDRDIEARGHGKDPLSDEELLGLLTKMIKQREESAKVYEEAGRADLSTQEREEIAVIQGFLPTQMTEAEAQAAIAAVIAEIGAHGLKDMGRTMAALKERHTGVMDFGKASGTVKALLTA